MTEQVDSWRSVIESRGIDVEETEAPDASGGSWFQTITRFTKRGFLRVTLSPGDEALSIHAQLAVPGSEDGYLDRLKQHLKLVSGSDWEMASEERPWVLEVDELPEEKVAPVFDAFERVAEHIGLAESGEDPAELADDFGRAPKEAAEETEKPEENEKADEAEPETDEEADEQTKAQPAASGGVFESIGGGESASDSETREEAETSPDTGDANLGKFRVRVVDGTIRAELELAEQPSERAEKELLSALARTLRARFDIKLLARSLTEKDGQPVVKLALEPASLGAASEVSLGDLSHDLGRYFERLKKFNAMGLSLIDVLAPGASRPNEPARRESPSPSRRERSERRRSKDEGRKAQQDRTARQEEPRVRRREDHRAAESDSSGVVFSFGADDLEEASTDVVAAGDYTDPRVKREDATTPLVDVVLRHPGYSDKSMRQVLSILLDVDYFEAGKLAKQAPCVIAWGISQERAQEFKRVIERAGGRVTLVEPDSLNS
ncbi:hypothetical protein FIV42_28675 [Persicimonas caeni]|uniref:Uncharacterized protein n=1 Tax=Persicimonas caeni TaxID=2292766 RepID=A0A4Y6Q1X8_PERCE|nr:hypothetical protein [Persicimonas caeni]QDG54576.1 hypothetical protein FIV42_28675 [Persicimonas caeni]QED35797.1 hypothetical protein FRD00_28670 [Persicimonas caeni]